MKRRLFPALFSLVFASALMGGCGGGDGGGLSNDSPGNNDLNTVVAFGDSITQGSECPCAPYPARLAGMIGKNVVNCGIGGSTARGNEGRAQSAIDAYHPAFMLILYGVNDVIHGGDAASIAASVNAMVAACKANNVVPVLATYPIPIAGHAAFSGGTRSLNRALRDVASAQGIHCVDLEGEFSGRPDLYMPDGLHPNDAGTALMALAFADLF